MTINRFVQESVRTLAREEFTLTGLFFLDRLPAA
jgi:hypothetical protein